MSSGMDYTPRQVFIQIGEQPRGGLAAAVCVEL